jgi:outer membrane lipopolysaccharide assembly protein LptE/RlpB
MKNHRHLNLLILLALCWLLSGCGFHLAKPNNLPPELKKVYVKSTHYSSLLTLLKTSLNTPAMQLVDTPEQANTILSIQSIKTTTSNSSDSATQQTRAYTLSVSITFSLLNHEGVTLYPSHTILTSTTHYAYPNQVLGNNPEISSIYSGLMRENILKLIFKLESNEVKTALSQAQNKKQ